MNWNNDSTISSHNTFLARDAAVPAASETYVRELDGIRAVAVALVVAAHYGLGSVVPGAFGVTLFFFLSGYLITTLFFAEFGTTRAIDIPRFYLRRWLRLTPTLLVFVVLGMACYPVTRTFVGGDPVPLGTTMAALFYYTNYYDLAWGMAPAMVIPFGICWSLAVEEHFYLAWPWIMRRAIRQPSRLCLLVAAACVAVLAWRLVARHALSLSDEYTYMATECRIDSILYGALLRLLFESRWAAVAIRLLRGRACRVLGLLALLSTFAIRDEGFRQTFRYTIQGIALMPFFAAVLSDAPQTWARRALASPPMVLIGRLSYAIYLFHLPARTPGEVYFGSPYHVGSVISGLVIAFALAYLLFVLVERPVAALRRRFRAHAIGTASAVPTLAPRADASMIALPREPTSGA